MTTLPESLQATMLNLEDKMRKQIKNGHSFIISEMNKTMNNIINLFLLNAEQLDMFIKSDVNYALNEIYMDNHAQDEYPINESMIPELDDQTLEPINSYDFINDVNESSASPVDTKANIILNEMELAMANPTIDDNLFADPTNKRESYSHQDNSKTRRQESRYNSDYKSENLDFTTSQNSIPLKKTDSSNSKPTQDESTSKNDSDPNKSKYFPNKPDTSTQQKTEPSTPQTVVPVQPPPPPPKPKSPQIYISKPREPDPEYEEKYKFKCEKCDSRYAHRQHLTVHEETVHQNRRNFICEHCNGVLSSKISLSRHVNKTHGRSQQ